MDGENDLNEFSKIPTIEDLAILCDNLNRHKVRYVIIGGFAVIHFGYIRATGDIDLLVQDSPDNIENIRKALSYLPDGEVEKIADTDLAKYKIVRVSGEITIDLIGKACDINYDDAKDHILFDEINGVRIPYLKPEFLIKTKMGVRPKDIQDRNFLQQLIDGKN
jgi:Nucleotidyl transferase of unknown function (DUF2204)